MPVSRIYGYTVLIGIGIGCTVLVGFSVVQVMLPPAQCSRTWRPSTSPRSCFMSVSLFISSFVYKVRLGTDSSCPVAKEALNPELSATYYFWRSERTSLCT